MHCRSIMKLFMHGQYSEVRESKGSYKGLQAMTSGEGGKGGK